MKNVEDFKRFIHLTFNNYLVRISKLQQVQQRRMKKKHKPKHYIRYRFSAMQVTVRFCCQLIILTIRKQWG